MWQRAWIAILRRGHEHQRVRKVKGHATQEDVEAGVTTEADKRGNDRSDENADEGVRNIAGVGLVRLGQWVADRRERYIALMRRIQQFIERLLLQKRKKGKRGSTSTKQSSVTILRYGLKRMEE